MDKEPKNYFLFDLAHVEGGEFSRSGDLLVPPGRHLAAQLTAAIKAEGFECSSPAQRDYNGWEWRFDIGQFRPECVLQVMDRALLVVETRRGLRNLLRGAAHSAAQERALEVVNLALNSISDVSNITAATKADFEHQKK